MYGQPFKIKKTNQAKTSISYSGAPSQHVSINQNSQNYLQKKNSNLNITELIQSKNGDIIETKLGESHAFHNQIVKDFNSPQNMIDNINIMAKQQYKHNNAP